MKHPGPVSFWRRIAWSKIHCHGCTDWKMAIHSVPVQCLHGRDCKPSIRFDSRSVCLLNIILLFCLRQVCDPCFLKTFVLWLGIPATWGLGSLDSSTTDCLASCQPLARGTTTLGACFSRTRHDPKTLLKGLDLSSLKVAWGSMGNAWKYHGGLCCCNHQFLAFDLNISSINFQSVRCVMLLSVCCTWNVIA